MKDVALDHLEEKSGDACSCGALVLDDEDYCCHLAQAVADELLDVETLASIIKGEVDYGCYGCSEVSALASAEAIRAHILGEEAGE